MPLDVFQNVFTLSANANLVNGLKGTQASLQEVFQTRLPSTFPGDGWQLVWGPVVWKHEKHDDATTGPHNSWYVAYHPSLEFEDGSGRHPAYVVAIAGTPMEAGYVWEKQNFAVDTVTNFKTWVDGGIEKKPEVVEAKDVTSGIPYISSGTVNTVHFLLTTPPPRGAISAGTTVLDFLTHLDKSAHPKFITTGHSLGGVLSPSLALALVLAGIIRAENCLTYPTAGPSPGDVAFSDLFQKTLPARKSEGAKSYQGWNLNHVNTLDIVPQAWCNKSDICKEQNLNNIIRIYGPPPNFLVFMAAVMFLGFHSGRSGVLYKPLPSQYFTGTFPPTPPSDMGEFVQIAIREHIQAYADEVGVAFPSKSQPPSSGVSEKGEIEKRFNFPIIEAFEWAREHPEEAQKRAEDAEKE